MITKTNGMYTIILYDYIENEHDTAHLKEQYTPTGASL